MQGMCMILVCLHDNKPLLQKWAPVKHPAVVQPITSDRPMERLVIDLVDLRSYKRDNEGYQWVLTMIDAFTSYPWGIPLRSKHANEVLPQLLALYKEFGPPAICHSDNGGEFVANIITDINKQLGVRIAHGGPYRPQCQGRVERWNQTLETQLGKRMTENNTSRWIDLLDDVVLSYRITRHPITNCTPFQAMFNRKPDLLYNLPSMPKTEGTIINTIKPI